MEIEKEVENFIKTINREPLKEYFPKEIIEKKKIDWNEDDIYAKALYQGYLDACRTFEWSEKVKKDYPNEKEKREYIEGKFESGIACKIREYLNNPKAYSFDVFHGKLCEELKECFQEEETDITYGQAQKIVNMAFKYLYCLYYRYGKFKENQFTDCHMPLDSYSLDWFKRWISVNAKAYWKEKEKFKKGSVGSWSSMEVSNYKDKEGMKYGYEVYLKYIREYCKDYKKEKLTPLELDFIVWPQIQKIMAAEAFIKTFEKDEEEIDKKDMETEGYGVDDLSNIWNARREKIRELIGD